MLEFSIFIWITSVNLVFANDQPVVETKYGSVRGEAILLASGSVIDTYLGIPFAKSPVDDLRFEAPQEPDPWIDTFNATILGNSCMQSMINSIHMTHFLWRQYSEDCLNLNVYSPQKDTSDLLPVMVYIHGGGYTGGGSVGFPGYFLAEKEVVVVTINYRLGIMGFAFTDDDTIPGNVGLLDQIQALQFVQENVAFFGGDPNRVTVFGQSAGASSLGLLLVSPLAEGLFHGAILQSGSELGHWAVTSPEKTINNILDMATHFDCPVDTNQEMIECLRDINARRLVRTRVNCTTATYCAGFVPIIDGTVIPDFPLNLRKNGQYIKVPEMIGLTENDANLFIGAINFPHTITGGLNRSDYDDHLWEYVKISAMDWPDPSAAEDVYQALRFMYADWPYFDDPKKNRLMLGWVYTDYYFGYAIDLQAKYHSQENDVYFYVYDKVRDAWALPDWLGAFHATEITFEFGWPFLALDENEVAWNHSQINPLRFKNFTDSDRIFSDFFMTLWTNFAKYGNPTPEPVLTPNITEITWPIFSEDNHIYMNLKDVPEVKQIYRQKEYAFWTHYMNYLIYGEEFQGDPLLYTQNPPLYNIQLDHFDDIYQLEDSEFYIDTEYIFRENEYIYDDLYE